MTDAAGPAALLIERFWWIAFWVLAAVFVATMTALAAAVWRERPAPAHPRDSAQPRGAAPPDARAPTERRLGAVVGAAIAATAVILVAFLVGDLYTLRASQHPPGGVAELAIRVTGHQWWWELEYEDTVPARRLRTANEIHVPVGVPVRLNLTSADVIHAIWIPELQGKRDLIPARPTQLWIQADAPGVYEGRCAEFCGHQHALMGLRVIAQPRAEFDAWYEAQLAPAAAPADSVARTGLQVFTTHSCVMCHTVRGTPAASRAGPDLTHLASRRTIAAGTLPNGRGTLAAWVRDPQAIKPGVKMPPTALSSAELEGLVAYLEGLR